MDELSLSNFTFHDRLAVAIWIRISLMFDAILKLLVRQTMDRLFKGRMVYHGKKKT